MSPEPDGAPLLMLLRGASIPMTSGAESSGSNILVQLFVLLLLILLNAFFAASEIAIISLNDTKIKKMAEEGHRKTRATSWQRSRWALRSPAFCPLLRLHKALHSRLHRRSHSCRFPPERCRPSPP